MSAASILSRLNRRDYTILPKVKIIFSVFLFSLFAISVITAVRSKAANSPTYLENKITAKENKSLTNWIGQAGDDYVFSAVDTGMNLSKAPKCILEGTPCPQAWIPGGAVGYTNQMVASLYNQPASGIEYLAQMKDNFLGKPAYAQGVGFKGLQPILPLWRAFRNIVYILSSIVFIFIGIMIMLRVKISPQAVVNIQNAIPQIITTLILVTFSYAIAGLIIDFSYLLQGVGLAVLFNAMGKGLNQNIIPGILSDTYTFSTLSVANLGTATNLFMSALPAGAFVVMSLIVGAIAGAMLALVPGANVAAPFVAFGGGALIILLIIMIFIIVSTIKFFFGLVKCYVNILFKIILAPFEIGMGAIPGTKIGINTWLSELIANVAVFPISLLFLVMINLLIWNLDSGHLWVPNLIDGSIFAGNLFGGGSMLIKAALGIVAMGILAKLPELIPQYIFMIKPSPWGLAVGQSFQMGQSTKTMAQAYGVEGALGTGTNITRRLRTAAATRSGRAAKVLNAAADVGQAGVDAGRSAAQAAKVIK